MEKINCDTRKKGSVSMDVVCLNVVHRVHDTT